MHISVQGISQAQFSTIAVFPIAANSQLHSYEMLVALIIIMYALRPFQKGASLPIDTCTILTKIINQRWPFLDMTRDVVFKEPQRPNVYGSVRVLLSPIVKSRPCYLYQCAFCILQLDTMHQWCGVERAPPPPPPHRMTKGNEGK